MGPRGWLIAGAAAAVMATAVAASLPMRYVVDGVSMTPGLAAGDVVRSGWVPVADLWRRPRRFERWAFAAEDGIAIKRVMGLPGEQLTIRDGDLVIDGRTLLKGPRRLAAVAIPVGDAGSSATGPHPTGELWSAPSREVLDDVPADMARSHVLLPVRDVGVAAIVRVSVLPPTGFVRLRLQVASRVVSWRLTVPGRHAVVAGRLDGHLVAAAWRLSDVAGDKMAACLPVDAPPTWQVAEPWPVADDAEPSSPQLSIATDSSSPAVALEHVRLWRDAHYRPGANGRHAWSLGPEECFVLGDHPAASTDSRQWGPIPRHRLRHRLR